MADIIDDGNATADFFLSKALQEQQRAAKKATPSGIGVCLYCAADVDGDRRWCDADCRDGWEAEQRRGRV